MVVQRARQPSAARPFRNALVHSGTAYPVRWKARHRLFASTSLRLYKAAWITNYIFIHCGAYKFVF